jgi:hypothetical protein
MEDEMSKMEMNNEVETEEFTDELSDEALDREGGIGSFVELSNLCSCR